MTNLTPEQKIRHILEVNSSIVTERLGDIVVQQLLSLIQEEKIKELEMIDATRHYGKDYQESLDEVEEYLYNRLQALKQPKDSE